MKLFLRRIWKAIYPQVNMDVRPEARWSLWAITAFSIWFNVFMEWLFFATKPSFMASITVLEKLRILWFGVTPMFLISWAFLGIVFVAMHVFPRQRRFIYALFCLWPAFWIAMTFLMLWVNITLSAIYAGVEAMRHFRYAGYLSVFAFSLVASWSWSLRKGMAFPVSKRGRCIVRSITLLWVISFCIQFGFSLHESGKGNIPYAPTPKIDYPNIIIFAADGLSAEMLSAYGYARDTTPDIKEWSQTSVLFCENAYPNAAGSAPSIASMLTGKWPTFLRLYDATAILTGRNAYEHLPGILRRHGYRNFDLGVRDYADAYASNFLDAFNEAGGRKEWEQNIFNSLPLGLDMYTAYFLSATYERVLRPLWHIFRIRNWQSPYHLVSGENAPYFAVQADAEKLDRLHEIIIDRGNRPFFVHLHLIGTHGPNFAPRHRIFSSGEKQIPPFDQNYYDDAVLDVDAAFRSMIGWLAEENLLEQTIVVFSSDHGKNWSNERIPVIIRFPRGGHSKRITENVCNVDIAPTILEYLGIPIPTWMSGISLLSDNLSAVRPIYMIHESTPVLKPFSIGISPHAHPFDDLSRLEMCIGQWIYHFNLESNALRVTTVHEHTAPLPQMDMPSLNEAKSMMIHHLEEARYKIPAAMKVPL